MFPVVVNPTGIDQDGIGVEQLVADVNLVLQPVDGQDDVLEHLLGERHGPHGGSGGQLHEGRLGGQHPAQEEEKERVVSEGDHGLQDPEDCLVVPQQILP